MSKEAVQTQQIEAGVNAKICPKCEEIKYYSEFGKDKSKASGMKSHCRSCRSVNSTKSPSVTPKGTSGARKVGRPRKYPPPIPKPNLKYKSKPEKRRIQTAYTRAFNKRKLEIEAIKQKEQDEIQRLRDLDYPFAGYKTAPEMYSNYVVMHDQRWNAYTNLRRLEKKASELHPARVYQGALWSGRKSELPRAEDLLLREYNSIRCEVEACSLLRRGEVLAAFNVYLTTHRAYPPAYMMQHLTPAAILRQRVNRMGVAQGMEEPMELVEIDIKCRYTHSDIPQDPQKTP